MGMVVRTNMAALNANNALGQASKAQQNGMQKLASGFKINKAADDASGLAISEKMKNQIKALDTAKDNCEDGANMIQTAEGYMAETHEILNRMTELAEKSANGVLADEDRDALQDEMDELCGEIDRIATTANFNGHKLLDGSLGSKEKVKLMSDPTTGTIKYSAPQKGSVSGGGVIDTKSAIASGAIRAGVTYTIASGIDGDLKDKGSVELTLSGKDAEGTDKNDIKVQMGIKDGDVVSIKKGSDTATTADGLTFKASAAADEDILLTYNKSTNTWTDQAGTKFTGIDSIKSNGKADQEFKVNEGTVLQIGDSSTSADRLEVNINSFHTDTLFSGLDKFKNTTADSTNTATTSQVKIREGNEASTYSDSVTVDISNKDNASAAADAIRQISNYVSDERGKLGAQQNRLEHTANNLTTASENTTAANSRIRDTDMAKEMMAYTSKNVIAQAAQSMLAQANSQPQNVLSLLQ